MESLEWLCVRMFLTSGLAVMVVIFHCVGLLRLVCKCLCECAQKGPVRRQLPENCEVLIVQAQHVSVTLLCICRFFPLQCMAFCGVWHALPS